MAGHPPRKRPLHLIWRCLLLALVAARPTAAEPSVAAGPAASQTASPAPRSPELERLVAWSDKRHLQLGVAVRDLENGYELNYGAEQCLNPASNMKVLTMVAALDELGPNFRYETGLYGRIEQGRAEQLTLRGNGDPGLETKHLWELAQALANLGLSSVGTLFVDQSRFDDQFVPPAFEQQPGEWASFRAPVSAVALDRNSVTMNVLPGAPNEAARVWFDPPGVVTVQGEVRTVAVGGGQNIQLTLAPTATGLRAEVGGHVAAALGRQRFEKRVDDPRSIPGLALKALLERMGISVQSVQLGSGTDRQRLVYHTSPPLSELLGELGKNSDNFYAEMIFKSLSANLRTAATDVRASTQASSVWLTQWLTQRGPLPTGTRIVNGSGLFDANRVAPETLVGALIYAYESSRLRSDFLAELASGGDGTLRSRFRDTPQDFTIRAKTGTLRDTIALSGYVLRKGTRAPLVFSVVLNGLKGEAGAAREQIDGFVRGMMR